MLFFLDGPNNMDIEGPAQVLGGAHGGETHNWEVQKGCTLMFD